MMESKYLSELIIFFVSGVIAKTYCPLIVLYQNPLCLRMISKIGSITLKKAGKQSFIQSFVLYLTNGLPLSRKFNILNKLGLHISDRCWCDTIPGYFGLNSQKILNLLIAISRLVSKSTWVIVAKKCGKNFVNRSKRGTTLKWRCPNDIIDHNLDIAVYTQFSPGSSALCNSSSLNFPSFSSPSPIISMAVK